MLLSGRTRTVEAAVRGNIMGGLGMMQTQISQQNHDALGCDGWEISAHGASAPDHEPIQGKQYSDKEYKQLNASLVRPIGELNCGHSASPIILGVNEPQYTEEELEDLRQENETGLMYEGKHYTVYEATQRQRKLERAVRDRKRRILIDEALGDEEKLQTDRINLVRLKDEYARFSKETGLPMQHARMEAVGFTWKHGKAAEKAAKGGAKPSKDTLSLYKKNKEYMKFGGVFDFGQARSDYENFLTSVPEKNRIYLQQSLEAVGYFEGSRGDSPFSYVVEDDEIWYDPSNSTFWDYTFIEANTHELAHRIDNFFVQSADSKQFSLAIEKAKETVNANPKLFEDYSWNHKEIGAVSDIIDALSEGNFELPAGHGKKYWTGTYGQRHINKEIYANLFSLESLSDSDNLSFIQQHFPDMYDEYMNLLR